jgi:HAD superfamily hydrolase (TIGR01490 family)
MDEKKPAALFDFDGTLTQHDTMAPFLLFVMRHFPRSAIDLPALALLTVPYCLRLVTKERMKTAALKMVSRIPTSQRKELFQRFHDQKLIPRYLSGGIERVRWHKQQGHTLVLASASVDTYLTAVARYLEFDLLVCTRFILDPKPAIVGPNCYGKEKVNRLTQLPLYEQTDWPNSYAYSDHPSDLPMMRLCGHPVATNPKPALARASLQEGWEIVKSLLLSVFRPPHHNVIQKLAGSGVLPQFFH